MTTYPGSCHCGAITIALASGHRIQVHGPIDGATLAPLLELLLRRC